MIKKEREELWEKNNILFEQELDKERERWMGANAKLIPSKKETDKLMTKKELEWNNPELKVSQDWEPRPGITNVSFLTILFHIQVLFC